MCCSCCCDCWCAMLRGYMALMKELPVIGKLVLATATVGVLATVGYGVGMAVNQVTNWYYGDFN